MSINNFAVIGNPVAHSLSPQIHQAFAKQCNIKLRYDKYCIDTAGDIFESFVRDFFKQGGAGLNITLPFKQRAFELVDQLTERARLAGAVNTLVPLSATEILGDNTDGVGLVYDLKESKQLILENKRILILGFGGATKGILPALWSENPKTIIVARRGSASCLPSDWDLTRDCLYENLTQPFDLIINSTPLSLSNQLPPITPSILHSNSFCYDLAYHTSRETAFTRWANTQEITSSDGLGMLISQALEAFYLWYPELVKKKIDQKIILSELFS